MDTVAISAKSQVKSQVPKTGMVMMRLTSEIAQILMHVPPTAHSFCVDAAEFAEHVALGTPQQSISHIKALRSGCSIVIAA